MKAVIADNLESVRDVGLRVLSGVKSGGLLLLAILINLALIPVVMVLILVDDEGGRSWAFALYVVAAATASLEGWLARSRGEAGRFVSVLTAYQLAQDVTTKRIYLETMERVLGDMGKIVLHALNIKDDVIASSIL